MPDLTLAYLKGKDAESEEGRNITTAANDAIFGVIYYRLLLGLSPFTKQFGEELVEQAIRGNRPGNLRG